MALRLVAACLAAVSCLPARVPPAQSTDTDVSRIVRKAREDLRSELTKLKDEAEAFKKLEMEAWSKDAKSSDGKGPVSDASIRLTFGRGELDLGIQACITVDALLRLYDNSKCDEDRAAAEIELNNQLSHCESAAAGAGSTLQLVAGRLEPGSREEQIATDAAARLKQVFFAIGKIKGLQFRDAKKYGDK